MADVDLDAGGLQRTLKDLFAGAAGGVTQVLLGGFALQRTLCPAGSSRP